MIAPFAPQIEERHSVLVRVCNLTEAERDLLQTTIAVLRDPGLSGIRNALMEGRVAMVMEGGEVTWEERP